MPADPANPFARFNQDAKKARGAPDPHLELWHTWDKNGRQTKHLEPLLDALEPTIINQAKKTYNGLGGSVPYATVEAKARIAAKEGLESYTPGKAKVKTWVTTSFMRMSDMVAKNRNFTSAPKPRFAKYQEFQNAKNEFQEEHGHEPSYSEMQLLLPDIHPKDLKPMMKEFRRELYIGGNPDPDADDGSLGNSPSQLRTILSLTPALLTPGEKVVFDQLYPTSGAPPSIAKITKTTGLSQNQVYRIRASIYKKVKPHLAGM